MLWKSNVDTVSKVRVYFTLSTINFCCDCMNANALENTDNDYAYCFSSKTAANITFRFSKNGAEEDVKLPP